MVERRDSYKDLADVYDEMAAAPGNSEILPILEKTALADHFRAEIEGPDAC